MIGTLTQRVFTGALVLLTSLSGWAHEHPAPPSSGKDIRLVENRGQWPKEVRYQARLKHGALWLTSEHLTFDYLGFSQKTGGHEHRQVPDVGHALRLRWLGASPNSQMQGQQAVETRYTYLIGNQPEAWGRNCAAFQEVQYRNLYPGIDLELGEESGHVKYTYTLRPWADPNLIQQVYEGSRDIRLEKGALRIGLKTGIHQEQAPVAWQIVGSQKREVPVRFRLNRGVVSYEFPQGYDRSRSLVIDPSVVFSSYSGSVADNWAHSATYGPNGEAWTAGSVYGPGYPIQPGAYQSNFQQGGVDIGLLKFSADGGSLLACTYIGGGSAELPTSCYTDPQGNIYVLGVTSSLNFPYQGGFQRAHNRGENISVFNSSVFSNGSDLVIFRLSADASTLLASTLLGGSGNEGIIRNANGSASPIKRNYGDDLRGEVILGPNGDVWVASNTRSPDFPLVNTAQAALGGGFDAVLCRFSSDLSQLLWSSFLGGVGDDAAFNLKISPTGEVFATGGTSSPNFPGVIGGLNPNYRGNTDGWLARFSATGSLVQSTYLGTSSYDMSFLLQLDPQDRPVVFGQTQGFYTTTPGNYNVPGSAMFLHKLTRDLRTTVFAGLIGSGFTSNFLVPTAFLIDTCGQYYIAGWGGNTNGPGFDIGNIGGSTLNLPVTPDAFQRTTNGSNFYVAVFNSFFTQLNYASYFGSSGVINPGSPGEHVDGGTSRFDKNGIVYQAVCAGCGGNSSFPSTPGAWSRTNRSINCNELVFKLELSPVKTRYTIDLPNGCAPHTVTLRNTSTGGTTYNWDLGDGTTFRTSNPVISHTFTRPGTYPVVLTTITSSAGCILSRTFTDTVRVFGTNQNDTSFYYCTGTPTRLAMPIRPGHTYWWKPRFGLDDSTLANPLANPGRTFTYTQFSRSPEGCLDSALISLVDTVNLRLGFQFPYDECADIYFVEVDLRNDPQFSATLTLNGEMPLAQSANRWQVPGPGNYTLSIRLISATCTLNLQRPVVVPPSTPVRMSPRFTAEAFYPSCSELPNIRLQARSSTDSVSYTWDLGEGISYTGPQAEHRFSAPGTYPVRLIAQKRACQEIFTQSVEVKPMLVPNLISPNGDGKNDFFVLPTRQPGVRLEVYNRWGQKMYSSDNYQNNFSGSGLSAGVYFITLKMAPEAEWCKTWLEIMR